LGAAYLKVGWFGMGDTEMAAETLVVAPEYLSIYVAGKRKISPPIDLDYGGIAATEDCITVPCLYWNEGDTTVTIAKFAELNPKSAPSYEGVLNTPEKILMISEANADIRDIPVSSVRTPIRIWIDHPTQPQHIVIAWG
jgi:hypothetical protein